MVRSTRLEFMIVCLSDGEIAKLGERNPEKSISAYKILNYLKSLEKNDSVVSGQFVGYASGVHSSFFSDGNECIGNDHKTFDESYQDLVESQVDYVGMIGVDYGFSEDFSVPTQKIMEYWKKGGLATISWHAFNPWTNENNPQTDPGGSLTEIITTNANGNNTNPNPAQRWKEELSRIATELQKLKDNDVVVLWRPAS